MTGADQPVALYDAMVSAIAECARVDEVKDMRDKAAALAIYWKQAGNLDAEREATAVRLRAERRVGELLKELNRSTPAEVASAGGFAKSAKSRDGTKQPLEWEIPPPLRSPFAEALEANGISRQDASRFQKLADVPAADFDLALEEPTSLRGIIARNKVREAIETPKPLVDDASLRLWGWLREFERRGYIDADLSALLPGMTPQMAADVRRLAPLIAKALQPLAMETTE